MLLGKNFDEIDASTIEQLVNAGATESVHLEFKRSPYGNGDSHKKELLKDISSFANALGGHLLIGVDEKDGAATSIIPISGLDIDQELQRLENVARTAIEPPIVGLRMKRVQVSGGDVIVIYVPRSYNPPHRRNFKGSSKFHGRNSSGAYELPMEELRQLFGQQHTVEERARAFTRERFFRVNANEGSLPLPINNGGLIAHVIPLSDMAANRRIEIADMMAQRSDLAPIGSSSHSTAINLDGFLVHRVSGGGTCHGYTQVFRNGSIEATTTSIISESRSIPSRALPERLLHSLNQYMKAMRAYEASPPMLLQMSFFRIKGVVLYVNPEHWDSPSPYETDDLHLPPSLITEYRDDNEYDTAIAEQMDYLWNAFGFEKCFHFDSDGKLIPK